MMSPLHARTKLIVFLLVLWTTSSRCSKASDSTPSLEILKGFLAIPDSSVSSFQAVLSDHLGNFSLGLLRLNQTQLALAVLHVRSGQPLWVANSNHLASWSDHTQFFFNGSLVISDPHTGTFWSTKTMGDRVVLANNSNLQVHKNSDPSSILWQSFHFPTDTLVENQNFSANMSLVSPNGVYSMRLGFDFIGLYAYYGKRSEELYLKRRALQAKAEIVQGEGPIYARLNSNGYLGLYQTNDTLPVDVQAFNNFQSFLPGLLILRLESDGNLKGYVWDGSKWALNYQAITETCDLPNACGSYGLCTPGGGCSCLDNRTEFQSGGCDTPEYGDLCGGGIANDRNYRVLRKIGVELAHKGLMRYETMSSVGLCENLCESNCSCWGALYNNISGFCYIVEHPIQTLAGMDDESKMGYFKMRYDRARGKKRHVGLGVGLGLLICGAVISTGVIGFCCYGNWKKKKRREAKGVLEEEVGSSPGPYKNLESASFRSIEMSSHGR